MAKVWAMSYRDDLAAAHARIADLERLVRSLKAALGHYHLLHQMMEDEEDDEMETTDAQRAMCAELESLGYPRFAGPVEVPCLPGAGEVMVHDLGEGGHLVAVRASGAMDVLRLEGDGIVAAEFIPPVAHRRLIGR